MIAQKHIKAKKAAEALASDLRQLAPWFSSESKRQTVLAKLIQMIKLMGPFCGFRLPARETGW